MLPSSAEESLEGGFAWVSIDSGGFWPPEEVEVEVEVVVAVAVATFCFSSAACKADS